MTRRQFVRLTAVPAVAAIGYAGGRAKQTLDRAGLLAGCHSDNLSVIAKHLREYAERVGQLPPAAELLTVVRGEHDSYLWCPAVGLPYQWNLRAAGMSLVGSARTPVVWCPPGGHGRLVGVVMLSDAELRVDMQTVADLRRCLHS